MSDASHVKPSPNRPSRLVIHIDQTEPAVVSEHTDEAKSTPPIRTPLDGHFRSLYLSTNDALRKSDTNDSLAALVDGSPSLSYVGDLEQLPSPMVGNGTLPGAHLLARRRSRARALDNVARSLPNSPSPANVASPVRPASPLSGSAKPRFPSSKALAHLLNEDKHRHVSLQLHETPLNQIEIPSIRRERSQSTVQQLDPAMLKALQTVTSPIQLEPLKTAPLQLKTADQQIYELPLEDSLTAHRYRALSRLGGGTFSKVELVEEMDTHALMALKVVELDSKEDIDPERLLTTIRREVEILRSVRHRLIVQLLGHRMMADRALLLLPFHPGGDLYTLASTQREAMSNVRLVKRIMAELVVATSHLHDKHIVHRDLKLENVLIHLPQDEVLRHVQENKAFATPLISLTDFGLARFIDPKAPELVTRCGSEDYAAPEIIMGQQYDGRQSDAWALGAIFYSLLEGRLPFDVIPGLEHRMKGKVLHRICRIEWRWVKLRQAGEYDEAWEGAKQIVSNLLRSRTKRWTVKMLLDDAWLRDEIAIVQQLCLA